MVNYPYEGEVQLLGFAWNPDDGNWARFRFHSDTEEGGHPFKGLPRGRENGQRFRIRFDLIADDETTTAEPAPAAVKERRAWNELDEREQSVLACKRPDFQTWICEKYGFVEVCECTAAAAVKEACVVKSRADLPLHATLRYRWAALWQDFQASQHGQGEQQAAQRRDGYGG